MTKKFRALILSCTTILLCVTVAVAGTFALFTDSASIRNHLKAGTLDIELNRILLTGETLAADGTVSTVNNTEEVAFTEGTSRTVFDTENSVVVPGSFFEATMEIVNNGNVAFGYWIEVVPASGTTADDLLSQLTFTVTPPFGHACKRDDRRGRKTLPRERNEPRRNGKRDDGKHYFQSQSQF